MLTRFIGDIHGTYNKNEYYHLTETCDKSIQVGDLGLGFSPGDDQSMFDEIDRSKHFFIRGNHDNPEVCERQSNHIESGHSDDHGIFFLNGGWSIDGPGCPWCPSYGNSGMLPRRTDGINWWSNEEHEQSELDAFIEEYKDCKPRIIVSHEGPRTATVNMFNPTGEWNSRTAIALEDMYQAHQPDLWIFGHWHKRKDLTIDKTRFICLEECGYIDLEV